MYGWAHSIPSAQFYCEPKTALKSSPLNKYLRKLRTNKMKTVSLYIKESYRIAYVGHVGGSGPPGCQSKEGNISDGEGKQITSYVVHYVAHVSVCFRM